MARTKKIAHYTSGQPHWLQTAEDERFVCPICNYRYDGDECDSLLHKISEGSRAAAIQVFGDPALMSMVLECVTSHRVRSRAGTISSHTHNLVRAAVTSRAARVALHGSSKLRELAFLPPISIDYQPVQKKRFNSDLIAFLRGCVYSLHPLCVFRNRGPPFLDGDGKCWHISIIAGTREFPRRMRIQFVYHEVLEDDTHDIALPVDQEDEKDATVFKHDIMTASHTDKDQDGESFVASIGKIEEPSALDEVTDDTGEVEYSLDLSSLKHMRLADPEIEVLLEVGWDFVQTYTLRGPTVGLVLRCFKRMAAELDFLDQAGDLELNDGLPSELVNWFNHHHCH